MAVVVGVGLEDFIEDDTPAAPAVEEAVYDDEEDEVNLGILMRQGLCAPSFIPRWP